jgi:ABC-type molybdenum transport system ATPase subunit/photorepair protein PhrA
MLLSPRQIPHIKHSPFCSMRCYLRSVVLSEDTERRLASLFKGRHERILLVRAL